MTIAEDINAATRVVIHGAENYDTRTAISGLTRNIVREAIGEAAMFVTRRAVRGILNSTWKAINI